MSSEAGHRGADPESQATIAKANVLGISFYQ